MDEREARKILIEILYTAVNEVKSSPILTKKITDETLASVCRLANKHDLAHIVSSYIYQNKIEIDKEIQTRLRRQELMSVYRHEQIGHAFEQICDAFDEAKIPYIPLKGSVIRPYYPYESMRTSCDIDILIHDSNLDSAIICLESKGYRCGKKHYHDVSMFSPNKIHLELHFNIQENIDFLDAVLKDAWEYALLTEGSRYDFRKDFFVFHMFAHMAYHFLSGGCGIRSLMDIWIMEHKMNAPYSCAEKLLKKAGIYKFAVKMSDISNKCFTDNNLDEFSELVLEYIYNGGMYGNLQNQVAVQQTKKGSKLKYALSKVFLPYDTIKFHYPTLQKHRWLTPFYEVRRWMKLIFTSDAKRSLRTLKTNAEISEEQISSTADLLKNLGL